MLSDRKSQQPRGVWCKGCSFDVADDPEFFRGFCGSCWREWQAG